MTAKNGAKPGRTTPRKPTTPASPEPAPIPEGRLRVLKVAVQPVYVLDTADGLIEVVSPVVEVAAADWDTWSRTQFTEAELEKTRLGLQRT